jgi:hypothetical protein
MNVMWRRKDNRFGRTRITFVQKAGPSGGLFCSGLEEGDGRFLSKPGSLMKWPLGVKERGVDWGEEVTDKLSHQINYGDSRTQDSTGP